MPEFTTLRVLSRRKAELSIFLYEPLVILDSCSNFGVTIAIWSCSTCVLTCELSFAWKLSAVKFTTPDLLASKGDVNDCASLRAATENLENSTSLDVTARSTPPRPCDLELPCICPLSLENFALVEYTRLKLFPSEKGDKEIVFEG